jgi:predicted lipoprotein with Yx(FWY)xxD motif
MTLYVFAKDTKAKIACTGGCTKFWPPLMVAKGAKVPTSMTGIPGTFGVVMLANGGDQLTYDGAPLYTFANDKKAGDVNGEGVISSWWAVVTSGGSTTSSGY